MCPRREAAIVVSAVAGLNVIAAGPLTRFHVVVRVFFGSPSSVATPLSVADGGRVSVTAVPALTVGGWFTGC